jgi:hypothetical protein
MGNEEKKGKPEQAIVHLLSSYECPVCGEDVGREDENELSPENQYRAETEKAIGLCGNCKTNVVQDVMVFRLKGAPVKSEKSKNDPPVGDPPEEKSKESESGA